MTGNERKYSRDFAYATKLIIGIFLTIIAFSMKSQVESESIVEKSQNQIGVLYAFDLFYYAGLIILIGTAVVLILPSMIYFFKKFILTR